MKRKIVFLLFIFLVSINGSNALYTKVDTVRYNRTVKVQNIGDIEDEKDKEKSKETKKSEIDNKKYLKKEIRQRRVYHKNLLYLYNKSFDEKKLQEIANNGVIISNLEKHLKKVSI